MSTGQYGTVSYSLDRFGVYRGYKTLIEYLEEQELVGWAVTTDKLTLNYLDRSQRGKQFFVRNIYFDCYIKQLSSRTAAYSHAYGDKDGNIALQGTEVGSSRVEVLRNGQYRAFWIGNRIPDAWRTDGSALPI
jgi:hypothetical protein